MSPLLGRGRWPRRSGFARRQRLSGKGCDPARHPLGLLHLHQGTFERLAQARVWVGRFVAWCNDTHRHSALNFITPDQRHRSEDSQILARPDTFYQ